MRIVLIGASGNVGTSVLEALSGDAAVTSILGIARRIPSLAYPKTQWAQAHVARDDLRPHLSGADVVIHLAWLIQPSRRLPLLRETNVDGSRRVFEAIVDSSVPALVYASSVGVYSPGPKDRAVDESWATDGTPTSFYASHKAEVERLLDDFEQRNRDRRVVRLRPALIFKKEAAAEIRRLFTGPFLPGIILRRTLIPLYPISPGLSFQCVHSYDVGHAYRLAATKDVRGAYNIAAEPVVDSEQLSKVLGARPLEVAPSVLRAVAAATWRARVQPTPNGWVDMGLAVPTMDTTKAREELGWEPRFSSVQALEDLLDGLRNGTGLPTPPLSPATGGPLRIGEILQGVGQRSGT